MNARTFGTDDKQAEFFARYGTGSYEETGRAIQDADRIAEENREARFQVGAIEPTQQSRVFTDQASDKAIDYLVSLSAAKTPWVAQPAIIIWAKSVDRRVVSDKIDELKAMPNARQDTPKNEGGSLERHNVPAGRYAVTSGSEQQQTVFVRVDRPTEGQWKGRIFVKVQAGDELHRVSPPTADALLKRIAEDGVQEAMLRYGREIGSCGHCGRTLTNEESRAAGIGPVCRGKMGW